MKISISIILLASSCRKKDIDIPFKEMEGDYEWFYSDNGTAFDVSVDQYGIRITKNGCMKLFKNGDLIEKYRILKTADFLSKEGTRIEADDKDDPIFFSLINDTLWTRIYPE